jgi:MFS transporter, putative metabolite:H+ symporter
LANSFDNYFCDDEFYLNLYASATYFGALLGYIFVTFLSDNYGRRKITIIAWAICTLGCIILLVAPNIMMASAGLFLCGFGSDSVLSLTYSIMIECYEDYMRQKHCAIIQAAFTGGALLSTLIYWLWPSWKITAIYAFTIPTAITLILMIIYVKETPMYLIK